MDQEPQQEKFWAELKGYLRTAKVHVEREDFEDLIVKARKVEGGNKVRTISNASSEDFTEINEISRKPILKKGDKSEN